MEVNSYSHAPYKGGGLEISPSPQGYNPEDPLLRKRGAQPGNLNALKHGYYSRRLKEGGTEADLVDEIATLRTLLGRASEQAAKPDVDLTTLLKALNTISLTTHRLAHLLQAQKELGEAAVDVNAAMTQAILEVARELGLQ